MDDAFEEAFWDYVCAAKPFWNMVLVLTVALLLLLVYSFVYIDDGSAEYVVAVISFAALLVSLVTSATVIYKCNS